MKPAPVDIFRFLSSIRFEDDFFSAGVFYAHAIFYLAACLLFAEAIDFISIMQMSFERRDHFHFRHYAACPSRPPCSRPRLAIAITLIAAPDISLFMLIFSAHIEYEKIYFEIHTVALRPEAMSFLPDASFRLHALALSISAYPLRLFSSLLELHF